jgi:hypothetical protein
MNPTKNNILLAYLGNYGPSYTSNNNIPNPWTMIPNLYYLSNPPLTFSNIINPTTYLVTIVRNWLLHLGSSTQLLVVLSEVGKICRFVAIYVHN